MEYEKLTSWHSNSHYQTYKFPIDGRIWGLGCWSFGVDLEVKEIVCLKLEFTNNSWVVF